MKSLYDLSVVYWMSRQQRLGFEFMAGDSEFEPATNFKIFAQVTKTKFNNLLENCGSKKGLSVITQFTDLKRIFGA